MHKRVNSVHEAPASASCGRPIHGILCVRARAHEVFAAYTIVSFCFPLGRISLLLWKVPSEMELQQLFELFIWTLFRLSKWNHTKVFSDFGDEDSEDDEYMERKTSSRFNSKAPTLRSAARFLSFSFACLLVLERIFVFKKKFLLYRKKTCLFIYVLDQ